MLLALIGKDWIDSKDAEEKRRLDDPNDFVRLEIGSALKRDIPVIPVLVRGASMPYKEQLPPDCQDFCYRNGVELIHARWDSDVSVLIKALSAYVRVEPKDSPSAKPAPVAENIPINACKVLSFELGMWLLAGIIVLFIGATSIFFFRPSMTEVIPVPVDKKLDASPSPKVVATSIEQDLQDFVKRFVRATKAGDIDTLVGFYGDAVDFYKNKQATLDDIKEYKVKYYQEWQVDTELVDNTITIIPLSENQWNVNFARKFTNRPIAGGKAICGITQTSMRVKKGDNGLKIISEHIPPRHLK